MGGLQTKPIYITLKDDPGVSVHFQYLPETISHNRSAKFAEVGVPGRSNPFLHYTGGDDTLKFTLSFENLNSADKTYVKKQADLLKSMTFGQQIVLTFGELYTDDIWVLTSVATEYSDFFTESDFLPGQAKVSLDFRLDL